jgi:CheY-like chemotaxis protein
MSKAMTLARNKHAILLYQNKSNLDLASAQYINQGLREKQLCVYASVYCSSQSHLSNITSQITDYQKNIRMRNLLVVDLIPFYDCAVKGNLTPFEEFEMQLQKELAKRRSANNNGVLIIADCANNLYTNKLFDYCEMIENWWHSIYKKWLEKQQQQEKNRNYLTIICPYSSSIFNKYPFDQHLHQISHNHSIVIDTAGHIITVYTGTKEKREGRSVKPIFSQKRLSKRILIAEPDPDLRHLYGIYLRQIGYNDIVITDSGRKCLAEALKIVDSRSYHVIVLDTHIKDIPVTQVAKMIIDSKPDQQIIFTTTITSDSLNPSVIPNGRSNISETILTKPFKLSSLSSAIDKRILKV